MLRGLAASVVLALVAVAVGCSHSGTGPTGDPGSISASADGITGRAGDVYCVHVYDYDWHPGATGEALAGFTENIGADPFASTSPMYAIEDEQLTGIVKTFEPAWYSVVFYVCPVGLPPAYFAEVRVLVDGDMDVAAPAWGSWTFNQGPPEA